MFARRHGIASVLLQGFGGGDFSKMLQQTNLGNCGGGNCGGVNPANLSQLQQQMRERMQHMMASPDMAANMRDALSSMQQGKMTIGMMGVGENERGKKVQRAAKLEFDPVTGKIATDFAEKQLDPDDPMLPRETVENYDTSGAIEIDLNEGTLPKQPHDATCNSTATSAEFVESERVGGDASRSTSSSDPITELEIEIESPPPK